MHKKLFYTIIMAAPDLFELQILRVNVPCFIANPALTISANAWLRITSRKVKKLKVFFREVKG